MRVQNGSPALTNARAVATSTSPTVIVRTPSVSLGTLLENSTTTSNQTVTIRVTRTTSYDGSAIAWSILADQLGGAVPTALSQLEASGQIPILDRSRAISGPDNDHNGVRDDIDNYINRLPDSTAQKLALRQTARALGHALVAGSQQTDQTTLTNVMTEISRAAHCIWRQYDPASANKKGATIEKLMINTRARFNAYDQYSTKMSGTSSRAPIGDSCDIQ